MPTKFFCDYCGIYLNNSSPHGRTQHADGKKHKENKVEYYRGIMAQVLAELMVKHNITSLDV
jgi:hypothetical protein